MGIDNLFTDRLATSAADLDQTRSLGMALLEDDLANLRKTAQLGRRAELIARGLIRRLNLQYDALNNAASTSTRPPRAIVVTGLPRSGTTLVHRALATSDSASAPVRSFLENPAQLADAAPKRWRGRAEAPGFGALHPTDPNAPEECDLMMRIVGVSDLLASYWHAPQYFEWLYSLPTRLPTYRWYASQLASHLGAPTVVLKSPTHLGQLDSLAGLADQVDVLVTWRDLDSALASTLELVAGTRGFFGMKPDADRDLKYVLDQMSLRLRAHLRFRRSPSSNLRLYDVGFKALMANPSQTLKEIGSALGLQSSEVSLEARSEITRPTVDAGKVGKDIRELMRECLRMANPVGEVPDVSRI